MVDASPERAPRRVTLLSPRGRAALATLHVEGPGAVEVVERFLRTASGRSLRAAQPGRILFGRWLHGSASEEVVAVRHSDESVEIHCHGGEAASRAILKALEAAGTETSDPGQWIDRHAPDALAAEAWRALVQARTERTAGILLDQFRGALRRALEEARRRLQQNDRAGFEQRLDGLLERASWGCRLDSSMRVVIAGPPNVGKSSLVNALAGYERSLVFDAPGTTRDAVTVSLALEGWPLEVVDTAGLRQSSDSIEAAGVQRARQELASADLLLLVRDVRQPRQPWEADTTAAKRRLHVANKIDLCSSPPVMPGELAVSARSGAGLPELTRAIVQQLVPHPPEPGQAVLFTQRQVAVLQQARRAEPEQADQLLAGLWDVPPPK